MALDSMNTYMAKLCCQDRLPDIVVKTIHPSCLCLWLKGQNWLCQCKHLCPQDHWYGHS